MVRGTAELLIVTAERLVGEHGVDAVSLRQIAEAAGQRNPAVVQYHFGTKEGLLRAILEYRVAPANARRHAMLDELERSGELLDLHRLLEAAIVPILDEQPADSRYLQFVARLPRSRAALARIFGEVDEEYGGSATRIGGYLNDALQDLPPPLRANRLSVAFDVLLRALADHQQQVENGLPDLLPWDLFVDDLILGVVNFLRAPVPPNATERLALTPSATHRSAR
jgi:AcrR family transcriptional regulator